MKKFALLLFSFTISAVSAQTYPAYKINLLAHIDPNHDTTQPNKYSGCWGWYQASKNREYAISGASNGTYFIDVTIPTAPVVRGFVPAKSISTWRELKTYQHYCYVVSDVTTPNTFQIIDMQYLPDSVHVVYDSGLPFDRAHTIWIDQDKMYTGLVRFPGGSSAMAVFSLANPTSPALLRRIEEDSASVGKVYEVHDMYVRNDTVYASAGWFGLKVMRLTSASTFTPIGSYEGYNKHGYNHSSYLTQNGKYVLFCDEVPNSLPMHLVNVQNFGNIQPVRDWQPGPQTTPHNPYILGNNIAVVSCYQDGVYVYDISNPDTIKEAGYFDTYPQGGLNIGDYGGGAYAGNWGAYPFLPSGIIIANDMENGVFILDPSAAYANTHGSPVSAGKILGNDNLSVYPNPASDAIMLSGISGEGFVRVTNSIGELVFEKQTGGNSNVRLDLSTAARGCYLVTVQTESMAAHAKIILR